MDRGDHQEAIYRVGGDRLLFLKTLGQACERTGRQVHSYVLMDNRYHLLLEIAVAAVVKRHTIMGNAWIGRSLEMGAAGRVSRYCSETEERPEVQRLMRQIKTSKGKD
jgi:hypothetical protein